VSVVPQPISRSNGQLVQAVNEVDVYFNHHTLNSATASDPGFATSANNPALYQLINTKNTATAVDDVTVTPARGNLSAASPGTRDRIPSHLTRDPNMIPTTLIAAPDDPAAFPESVAGYFSGREGCPGGHGC